MARGSDPDSRPISVAELLARAKEQDAQDSAAGSTAASATPTGTGRRRRGGKGTVSVAELTGEIPRVDDTNTPPPTRDLNSADVSRRAQADRADSAGATATPGEPERPVLGRRRAGGDPTEQSSGSDATPGTTADSASQTESGTESAAAGQTVFAPDPEPDGQDSGPQTTPVEATRTDENESESSSGEVDHGDHSDEETTGVIPSVQAYSQVDDSDPEHDREDGQRDFRTAAERERDFQRYRNFEDLDDAPAAEPKPKKRKRGLFGFGRKTDDAVGAAGPAVPATTDGRADDNTDHEVTQLIPAVGESDPAPARSDEPTRSMPAVNTANQPESHGDEAQQTAPQPAADAPATSTAGRYLRFDVDDNDVEGDVQASGSSPDLTKRPASQPDPREVDLTGTDPVSSGMPGGLREVGATDDHGPLIHPQVHPSAEETEAVKARLTSSTGAVEGRDDRRADDQHADGEPDGRSLSPEPGSGHSPAVQWLVLIGQVIAGLAVGVALFWGFTELWRWNVYFALVLAVAVIFGMVTLVHVVRRSQDLISTLLALGVGLLVTIGPLVLLLVAGD
jgi:hypothetical protein